MAHNSTFEESDDVIQLERSSLVSLIFLSSLSSNPTNVRGEKSLG